MFKLLSLKFDKHPYLGNIHVTFAPDEEKDALNYTTLIIGPNGTGKSQILLAVVQIFNRLAKRKQNRYGRPISFGYDFILRYKLREEIYVITQSGRNFTTKAEGSRFIGIPKEAHIPIPSKVLLSSYGCISNCRWQVVA